MKGTRQHGIQRGLLSGLVVSLAIAQIKDRDIVLLPNLRGREMTLDTEAVSLRLQDRVVFEDQGSPPGIFLCVSAAVDHIEGSAGQKREHATYVESRDISFGIVLSGERLVR